LVAAISIERQLPQQLTVFGEDPHIQVGYEDEDADPGVATPQPDVMQPGSGSVG
jgi:hypothetical protein